MIEKYRDWYNQNYTDEKYQAMLDYMGKAYNAVPKFRVAETPFFIPNILKERLIEACDLIQDVIVQPDFKDKTAGSISNPKYFVPNEDAHTSFLQMDFAVCLDENGDPYPNLIEVQGFPSVYFLQLLAAQSFRKFFDIPSTLSANLNDFTEEDYVEILRKLIVADQDPKEVILLEIDPENQTTQIDFAGTEHHLGVKSVCLSKVIKRGNKLYYKDDNGAEVHIKRIYNRVIFDELYDKENFTPGFDMTKEVDVEWAGHPNWYNRISKYTLPFLKNKYVPDCHFLHECGKYPEDLENFVLKPLYSFAGSGVELDLTKDMLNKIKDPDNYLLQRKVSYEPVIKTPDNDPVKVECRMLMLWLPGEPRARIVNNLSRLSKGKMIGVKYNKNKTWVGGSVGFFEREHQ
jgi:hypothetical protein